MKLLILSVLLFASNAEAALRRLNESPRTVMVQLFGWPWAAIGEECERVLGPAGFAAVQVPPAQEHIIAENAPWWERYQPVSYHLESRSGTESEFAAMVQRCGAAGVDVYADVVLNHMNALPQGYGSAGSPFTHYEYPGLWNTNDFHHCGRNGDDGLRNFKDLYELQNCELLGMADLDTSAPKVQAKQADFLNRLMDYGVKGFRVDAAKHMAAKDIEGIFKQVPRENYRVLELILTPGEPVQLEDYLPAGDVNNFALSYSIGSAFLEGDLSRLPQLPALSGVPSDNAVVFLENQDLERRPDSEPILAYRRDPELNKLGTVFMLTWPYGYPMIYSGYLFNTFDEGSPLDFSGRIPSPFSGDSCMSPWTCLHRSPWVRALVDFRNRTNRQFEATQVWPINSATLAYGRGPAGHVVITIANEPQDLEVPTQLQPGRYCNLAADQPENDCAMVDHQQVLHLQLQPRSAFVAIDPNQTRAAN